MEKHCERIINCSPLLLVGTLRRIFIWYRTHFVSTRFFSEDSHKMLETMHDSQNLAKRWVKPCWTVTICRRKLKYFRRFGENAKISPFIHYHTRIRNTCVRLTPTFRHVTWSHNNKTRDRMLVPMSLGLRGWGDGKKVDRGWSIN